MASDNLSISDAARRFAQSLSPDKHLDSQEALRFARWFGEERAAPEVKPSDLEMYVDSFAKDPSAGSRAEALKGFLAYSHKQGMMPARLVSHVRVRRSSPRSRGILETTPEVQLTSEGKSSLERELAQLIAQRPRIAEELHLARADGDVSENAPLDAARETQGQVEARIRELEGMLRHAVVVEHGDADPSGRARVGSNIVLANVMTGAKLTYQLVNAAEARAGAGRLSVESPVGSAVMGKRIGDEIKVTVPSGTIHFLIESIES